MGGANKLAAAKVWSPRPFPAVQASRAAQFLPDGRPHGGADPRHDGGPIGGKPPCGIGAGRSGGSGAAGAVSVTDSRFGGDVMPDQQPIFLRRL